jgi:hypothetical protein
MNTDLHAFLAERLGDKPSVTLRISEIEQLAGEEWLLEVSFQAQKLRVRIRPHPKDVTLAVLERESM